MNIERLLTAVGYKVYATDVLPCERLDPETGEKKRTDYIVDEGSRCVWMSRAALDALREKTASADLLRGQAKR